MDPLRVATTSWRPASPWLAAPPPPGAVPEAPVEILERPLDCGPDQPPKVKPTWKQRAWTAGRRVVLGGLLAGSVISAIGYHANRDAIHSPVSVARTRLDPVETRPPAAEPPAPVAQKPHAPADLVLVLPESTLQDVSRSVQTSPAFKAHLESRIAQTRTLIQAKLQNLPPLEHQELLEVEVPLPTGDRAFFHVGGVDLPSAGVKSLQPERVPVAVRSQVQARGAPVRVEIRQVLPGEGERPQGPPGAVYLGSYRTTVHAEAPAVQVSGRVEILADLGGAHTRPSHEEWLERQAAAPEDATVRANLAALDRRLANGRRLEQSNVSWAIKALLADQGATFRRDVRVPQDRPLIEGVHHLWLGPDVNADGKADLMVTEQLSTPGIDRLRLEGGAMESLPHAPVAGWPVDTARDHVRDRVQQEIATQLEAFGRQVPGRVRDVVRAAWADSAKALQETADEQLQAFYQSNASRIVTPGVAHVPGRLKADLGCLLPTPGGLGASVCLSVDIAAAVQSGDAGHALSSSTGRARSSRQDSRSASAVPAGDATRYLRQPELIPESIRNGMGAMIALSGDSLNAALRDTQDGGTVDWQGLLRDMAKDRGLKKLEFNRGPDGALLTPQLQWSNGRTVVAFEVTAEVAGFAPVGTATGLVSGATGLMDGGAGALQDGLGEIAGAPGKVVGGIIRSPFWLIDKLAGGVKDVVDGTVGVVVDALPEAGTRPVASVRIEVPVRLEVQDGVLAVRPTADGVHIAPATGEKSSVILPTNLVQSAIAQAVAESDGSRKDVGQGLGGIRIPVDLRERGVQFEAAATGPSESGRVPDVFVRVTPTDDFSVEKLSGQ